MVIALKKLLVQDIPLLDKYDTTLIRLAKSVAFPRDTSIDDSVFPSIFKADELDFILFHLFVYLLIN